MDNRDLAPQSKEDILKHVGELINCVITEAGRAIYFSSSLPKNLVDEIRKRNPHLTSPWDTDAGKEIMKLNLDARRESSIGWDNFISLRNKLIHIFAQRASGNFTIVFPEQRDETYEATLTDIVLPTIQRNSKVRTINNRGKHKVIGEFAEKRENRPGKKGKLLRLKR